MLAIFATLLGLFAGSALAVYVTHRFVRPAAHAKTRAPDALTELHARGGRQRFRVQLVELGALFSLWAIGLAFLPLAQENTSVMTWAGLGSVGSGLIIATWWLWRRGALREALSQDESLGS